MKNILELLKNSVTSFIGLSRKVTSILFRCRLVSEKPYLFKVFCIEPPAKTLSDRILQSVQKALYNNFSKSLLTLLLLLFTLDAQETKPPLSNFLILNKPERKAEEKKKTQLEYNPLADMEFVKIPTGSFKREDGVIIHITKSFYLGKYEVTQKQWKKIMINNPSNFQGEICKLPEGCENNPVERVSWADVESYIAKLNEKAENGKKKYRFRLPTEAEWEYAARAGTNTNYYWGDTANKEYAWWSENADSITHAVGTKKPNAFGLYDMSGNVWEWCSDWKADYNQKETIDPIGPITGTYRVIRGGSWYFSSDYLRSSFRYYSSPNSRSDVIGFRLLLVESDNL